MRRTYTLILVIAGLLIGGYGLYEFFDIDRKMSTSKVDIAIHRQDSQHNAIICMAVGILLLTGGSYYLMNQHQKK